MTSGQEASTIITSVPLSGTVQHLQRYVVTIQVNPTAEVLSAALLRRRPGDDRVNQWPDGFSLDLDLSDSDGSIQDDAGGTNLVYSLQARAIRNGPSGHWFIVDQSITTAVSTTNILDVLHNTLPERDNVWSDGMIVPWASNDALEYRLMCQNWAAYHDGHKPLVSLGTYSVTSHRSEACNAQFYDYQLPGEARVSRSTLRDLSTWWAPVLVFSENLRWATSVADGDMAFGFTTFEDSVMTPTRFIED